MDFLESQTGKLAKALSKNQLNQATIATFKRSYSLLTRLNFRIG